MRIVAWTFIAVLALFTLIMCSMAEAGEISNYKLEYRHGKLVTRCSSEVSFELGSGIDRQVMQKAFDAINRVPTSSLYVRIVDKSMDRIIIDDSILDQGWNGVCHNYYNAKKTLILHSTIRLRTAFAAHYGINLHEVLHAVGVDHEDEKKSIMNLGTAGDLTEDDKEAITKLYPLNFEDKDPEDYAPTNGGGDDMGGGCFITTAIYSPKEVQLFKNFRDDYLNKFLTGRKIMALYYEYSPPIANYISQHEDAKILTRSLLQPMLSELKTIYNK